MEEYMKGVPFLSKMVYEKGKGTVVKNLRFLSPTLGINGHLACVASISSRVITRNFEREPKKNGRGRGRGEEETLARKPHDSGKRPLIFHGLVHL